jgi:hypothetical protein
MEKLNGYWVSKADDNVTVAVDRVFKAGHVTGFKYTKTSEGVVHSQFKASQEELKRDYKRMERSH